MKITDKNAQEQTSILIIYTGGTIGMVQDPITGALKPFKMDTLYKHIPELKQSPYGIDSISFDPLIDSSDVGISFIEKLAAEIEKNYHKYDGFVVLHGTDTMAYSASCLSFMLENNSKPIIFTGAQLPLGILRSDGRENMINALEMATAKENGAPLVREVAICFENNLFRACRTRKANAEDFRAFRSDNYPPLVSSGVHFKYNKEVMLPISQAPLRVHKKLNNSVVVLKLFPGISPQTISAILNIPGLKGVVLESYGSGNAPTDEYFIEEIKKAVANGVIIYNVTQCERGAVEEGKYAASLQLYQAGVVPGFDITTEAAVAKMMFLLAVEGLTPDEMKKKLTISLRGELTHNLF